MRPMGGWTTAMLVVLCSVGAVASATTAGDGVDGVVRAIDARYHVHGKGVPMMWAVSLVARGFTHGGVRAMRVVQYEHFPREVDRAELEGLVRSRMGPEWSPMVRNRTEKEMSMVYVQPHGSWMRMVVVDAKEGEMDVVQIEMKPEALARWTKEQGGSMAGMGRSGFSF